MPVPQTSPPTTDVVVVGAGVVGLTSAVVLADAGHRVEVWAADGPSDATSAASAATWTPLFQPPIASLMAWAGRSLTDFCELGRLPDSGVSMIDGLRLGTEVTREDLPPLTRLFPDLRPCPSTELPPGVERAMCYRAPLIDMGRYVPWLLGRLEAAGAPVHLRRVESLAEALGAAPVVVNAAGLGAGELAADPTVKPVFTQYVVTENPEKIDRLLVDATSRRRWVSLIPHPDRVHLGGVRIPGRTDPRPDRELASETLRRARDVEPRLEAAHVLRIDTGVLPTRPTMRVEAERRRGGLVVHAYGLGGTGVTLSWGVAREVARLVAG